MMYGILVHVESIVRDSMHKYAISRYLFFQAEDGIRDLVRSRGLGDVYKRQVQQRTNKNPALRSCARPLGLKLKLPRAPPVRPNPVSYTHLTLPTSDLV